jgi:hypothetical protein
VALACYAALGASACGATRAGEHGAAAPRSTIAASAEGSCAATVAGTLGEVAGRIYRAASSGSDAAQAVHRLQSSTALARAVSAGDAASARVALRSLLLGQIARVEILRSGHVLAAAGSGPAIAPVRGTLPGTGGARFVLSVQPDRTYLQVAHQVTGAEVLLLSGAGRQGTVSLPAGAAVPQSGALTIGSREFQVASIAGASYPSGPLRIAVLAPSSLLRCPPEAAATRAAVLGRVGERIYEEEASSPTVKATLRRMESDAAFKAAVAARDTAATRRAIIGFFAAHIHVVRVRVTVGGRLLYDLGGPHVLAPVEGTLRQGGRTIGRFLMAVQDDAGYLRLAGLFTGAQVLMRTAAGQVEGTLRPGPASVPERGTVSYRGRSYQAYSFSGTAFPSGRLRISLLF